LEFECLAFAVPVGIAALNNSGTALGVIARLQHHYILLGVLAAHFSSTQQLRGLVASHRSQQQFKLTRQRIVSLKVILASGVSS
jgi:hypothetical protein